MQTSMNPLPPPSPSNDVLHILRKESIARRRRHSLFVRNCVYAAVLGALHGEGYESPNRVYRGRQKGTYNIDRGVCTWVEDYLSENAAHSRTDFRKTFRVPRAMFERIHDDLMQSYPKVWATRVNAAKKTGVPSLVKVLMCFRILGTGRANHDRANGARMGAETARVYFKTFCKHIVELYGDKYLNHHPSQEGLGRLEEKYSQAGFPGCVGVVSCAQIAWKNCPFQQRMKHVMSMHGKVAVIPVEVWCDRELYIWSWFVDRSGKIASKTNGNVLRTLSPLFQNILNRSLPFILPSSYTVKAGRAPRKVPYFASNEDYPDWPIFAKPVSDAETNGEVSYQRRHEGVVADFKKTIGVLKSRFMFMKKHCFLWYIDDIIFGCKTCVILHNMLVRMAQNGDFYEDEAEYPNGINLVTELHDDEAQDLFTLMAEELESETVAGNAESDMLEEDVREEMEGSRGGVFESRFTSAEEFRSLKEELILRNQ